MPLLFTPRRQVFRVEAHPQEILSYIGGQDHNSFVPWVGLQCVNGVFPDHTYFLLDRKIHPEDHQA